MSVFNNNTRRVLSYGVHTAAKSGVVSGGLTSLISGVKRFATRTVDNTRSVCIAKPDIRPESRFFAYHTCIRLPVKGGCCRKIDKPLGALKTRMVWLPDGEKN